MKLFKYLYWFGSFLLQTLITIGNIDLHSFIYTWELESQFPTHFSVITLYIALSNSCPYY